jgi:hypothetical protein
MVKVKLSYNPKTNKILICKGNFHANEMPVKSYDSWVRAIWFPDCKTIYFRFYSPKGEYTYLNDDDYQLSFNVCEKALKELIRSKTLPKGCKVLFWETNKIITQAEIGY